jgi:hypothetical protein
MEGAIEPTPPPSVREATLQDIDNLQTLTLDDFAADFSAVKLPGGPLSEGDLSQAVDSFLDSLRER